MSPVTDRKAILAIISERPERIRRLFIEKGFERTADDIIGEARMHGVPFRVLSREAFARQAKGAGGHIWLDADEFSYYDQDAFLMGIRAVENPFLCAFDGIYDPQNLGNIIRSSACFGVDALILPREHSCGVNETAVKISRGGVDHARIVRVTNLARYLDDIKRTGVFCYGLDESGARALCDVDLTGPVCLVFGKEDGLRRLTREKCDEIVKIPTSRSFSSLNVATCFAVCVYEAQRQKAFQTIK